jgi:hypothetical protein
MARDKQLVVRVTEAMRADFQSFCGREGVKASTVLADIVERLCQGELSLGVALGRSESPVLAMEEVEDLIAQRVETALLAWLGSSQLAERIEAIVAPRLGAVEASTQRVISEALAVLKVQEASGDGTPKLPEPKAEKSPAAPAESLPKKDLQIDLSAYDPTEGFTAAKLAKAIGLKSSTPIFGAIDRGGFDSWSRKKDPAGLPWYFKGEKSKRRYFRGEATDSSALD